MGRFGTTTFVATPTSHLDGKITPRLRGEGRVEINTTTLSVSISKLNLFKTTMPSYSEFIKIHNDRCLMVAKKYLQGTRYEKHMVNGLEELHCISNIT